MDKLNAQLMKEFDWTFPENYPDPELYGLEEGNIPKTHQQKVDFLMGQFFETAFPVVKTSASDGAVEITGPKNPRMNVRIMAMMQNSEDIVAKFVPKHFKAKVTFISEKPTVAALTVTYVYPSRDFTRPQVNERHSTL